MYWRFWRTINNQFSSGQDVIYTLRKVNGLPSLTGFLNVGFETVPMLGRLTTALSRRFKEDRRARLLFTPVSLWCCGLPAHKVSQAPQHFRGASHLWRLLCSPVYLLGSFPLTPPRLGLSGVGVGARGGGGRLGKYILRNLRRLMSNIVTRQSRVPIPLLLFCSKLPESVKMLYGLSLTSRGNSAKSLYNCFHFHWSYTSRPYWLQCLHWWCLT